MNNMVHICKLKRELYFASVEAELELSPEDYLYCEDESDLKETVKDDLKCAVDIGNVEYQGCNTDFEIPKEFIDEWKKLKQN